MKRIILTYFCVPALIFADEPLAKLTLLDGTIYKSVKVNRVEPDGLLVSHQDGVARIPFERLPEDVRNLYGYGPVKAAAYAKAKAAERGELILKNLTLPDGTVYEGFKITGADPDGLRVMHRNGTVKIPYEKLPDDLRAKYQFDSAKAAAYLKAKESAEAKILLAKAVDRNFKVIKVLEGGCLAWRMIERRTDATTGGDPFLKTLHAMGTPVFVTGWSEPPLADGKLLRGKFAEIGAYTFEGESGTSRTISKYQFISK